MISTELAVVDTGGSSIRNILLFLFFIMLGLSLIMALIFSYTPELSQSAITISADSRYAHNS